MVKCNPMKTLELNDLPDDVSVLKQQILVQQTQWKNVETGLLQHIQLLEEKLRLANLKRFGKSSEKDPGQCELFDEAEQLREHSEEHECPEEITEPSDPSNNTAAVSKPKRGRKPLPEHLPRVVQEHGLEASDKICSCGCQKTYIGDQVSEQLDIIPAQIQVIQHRRKQYVCHGCTSAPATATMPLQPIPKSNASPGLLAYVITAKFQDALPLYRQEAMFKRLDIHLPRNTLAQWVMKASRIIQPLYNLLQERLLDSGYLHMDETSVQVLKEPGREASTKSYMWVRKTGDPDCPIVLFDYFPSRRADVIATLLGEYQGYLQTDGYAAYQSIGQREGITTLGCWAHARRKFVEADKVAKTPKGKIGKAGMGVQLIRKLYAIEQKIQSLTPDERYRLRQQQSRPQLEKIRTWLDQSLQTTLPKSALGKALGYLHNHWDALQVYITDGRLNIDNNPVENAIRPFAVGRKNWMFSDTQAGARASALLYSLIETAKANNLEPYAYLKMLFEQLPQALNLEDYEALLPWEITT